jgi:hypothetical protein
MKSKELPKSLASTLVPIATCIWNPEHSSLASGWWHLSISKSWSPDGPGGSDDPEGETEEEEEGVTGNV